MKGMFGTKISNLLGNPVVKTLLPAAAVAVFGFVLLNLTFLFAFLFDFLINSLATGIVNFFFKVDPMRAYSWFPPIKHALFAVIIGLISWPVFKSRLGVIYKATYMTVPSAVVLATIGILLYRWPAVVYLLGGLSIIGVLLYFYRTRKPWLYYYSVILVGLALTVFSLLGGEI